MKSTLIKWTLSLFILILIFQSVNVVKADDDDDHEEKERYEKYERSDDKWDYEDDDHDEDNREDDEEKWEDKGTYENENMSTPQNTQNQNSFWNIWTRDTSNSRSENLPFQNAKEIAIELNGINETFYIIPQNGQLLVSGEKFAEFINAEYKFYEQSKIMEVSKDQAELIIRAGSNAAYENMIKTPIPAKALYYEKSVYLPISVMANTFGYRVTWDEATEIIKLEEIL